MAAFVPFQSWREHMCEAANCGSDSFVVALTAAANAPDVAADHVLADLTVITYTNLSSRTLTTSTAAESGGEYAVLWADLTLSASGGAANAFRYVIPYDDTVASPVVDPLVAYYDYGSDLTLANGESLTVDWTGNSFTVQ